MSIREPMTFQQEGAEWLAGRNRALLCDEMGLGKTCQAILAADRQSLRDVLVVAPASVITGWTREFEAWSSVGRPSKLVRSPPDVEGSGVRVVSYAKVIDPAVLNALRSRRWDLLIVDEAHTEMPEMPLIKFLDGYETVGEIEAALGIPDGNLAATLERYNENAAAGEDPDLHKQPEYLAAQDNGPWAVFDLSLGRAMYSGFTMGGLAVSIDGEVLREDGTPVPGLYAVGACASNIAEDGKSYASGTQLGEGSFFGRRAGAHATR